MSLNLISLWRHCWNKQLVGLVHSNDREWDLYTECPLGFTLYFVIFLTILHSMLWRGLRMVCSVEIRGTSVCVLTTSLPSPNALRCVDGLRIYNDWRTLRWRHNGCNSVSNHQPHDCLPNRLFRRRSKKTSKIRVTGPCAGNSPGTGEFPAQMASNAENVSIWWRHHENAWAKQFPEEIYRLPCIRDISWEKCLVGSF